MPSHADRLLQRITDALDAEDQSFKIVRIAPKPGEPDMYPPILCGGNNAQRLAALEDWSERVQEIPPELRARALNPALVERIENAISELFRLRKLAEQDR